MKISKQIKEFKADITEPCVYEIYNIASGKRYIGFTGEPKSRLAEHFTHCERAVQQYAEYIIECFRNNDIPFGFEINL